MPCMDIQAVLAGNTSIIPTPGLWHTHIPPFYTGSVISIARAIHRQNDLYFRYFMYVTSCAFQAVLPLPYMDLTQLVGRLSRHTYTVRTYLNTVSCTRSSHRPVKCNYITTHWTIITFAHNAVHAASCRGVITGYTHTQCMSEWD